MKDSVASLRNALSLQESSVATLGAKLQSDSAALIAKIKADSIVLGSALPAGGANGDNFLTWDGSNWVAKKLALSAAGNTASFEIMPPYVVVNFQIAAEGIYPSRDADMPFLGEIMMTGWNFATRGWYLCNGQLLSIAQNTALFSLLGTTYGGNGMQTFGLPNFQGRMPMHQGQGLGLANRVMGEYGGRENVTLYNANMPAHTHTLIQSAP